VIGYAKNRHLARRAHVELGAAVLLGVLVRPDACERCKAPHNGEEGFGSNLHAHHEDYAEPLQVRWLCRVCHLHRHDDIARERGQAVVVRTASRCAPSSSWLAVKRPRPSSRARTGARRAPLVA
jgi:hypothetical protein